MQNGEIIDALKVSNIIGIKTAIPESVFLESLAYILECGFNGKRSDLIYGKKKATRTLTKKLIGNYYTDTCTVSGLKDIAENLRILSGNERNDDGRKEHTDGQ